MKKRVLSFILTLIMLFCSIPMTLFSSSAEELSSTEDKSELYDVKVSIEAHPLSQYTDPDADSPEGNPIYAARPSAFGEVWLYIKADKKPTSDITVSYTTSDMSAVAKAGDYEAQTGTVTLTPEKYEVLIAIKTNYAEYGLTVRDYETNEVYSYSSRKFAVSITSVIGEAELNENKSSVICSLCAEHNLEAYKHTSQNRIFLAPYSYRGAYIFRDFFVTPTCSHYSTILAKSIDVNFPVTWTTSYLDTGIDAKVYMAIDGAHVDESSWNSTSSLSADFAGVILRIQGKFHNNEVYGWGPAFIYDDLKIADAPTSEEKYKNKYKDYYNENFQALWWQPEGLTRRIKLGYRDDATELTVKEALQKNYIIKRRYFDAGAVSTNDTRVEHYFIMMQDSLLKETKIELVLRELGGYARRLTDGDLAIRLEDITAPVLSTVDGDYEIYHNFDTVTKGEKLRIALRFNEPVHVDTKKLPYITGKVNGIGTGVEPHPYAVCFNYAGGSGTDTLYFEANYTSGFQITSISGMKFFRASSIKDYGGVNNCFEGISDFVIDNFNLDMRKPVVSVLSSQTSTNGGVETNGYVRSMDVDVTVSGISDKAVLYYMWSDSNDPSSIIFDEKNKIELNNVSLNSTQTVTIQGGGDGVKYLHLKAVSRYGTSSEMIQVKHTNTDTSANCLGPYKFDNSSPTYDESTFKPVTDERTDMTKKTYQITIPQDAASGFAEMNMYYVGENGEGIRINENPYTPSNFPSEITLLAETLGIGENTRKENIVIYFTITDNLGNIATDVGRHQVTFDTNKYIDVASAGSAAVFKEKIEAVDEYTFLFSDGSTPQTIDDKQIYYKFEFGIKKRYVPQDATFSINVMKNGEIYSSDNFFVTAAVYNQYDGLDIQRLTTVSFTKPLEPGYYDIQLLCYEGEISNPSLISRVYRVYVGNVAGELGQKIQNGTLLINKVYQLPAKASFYYMKNDSTMSGVLNEVYSANGLRASFSSYDKAKEYVTFNEYRDLFAVRLTSEMAEALNNGTSDVQKAIEDKGVPAEEGYVWIRYKSSSWVVGSNATSDWVYYYYGTSMDINVSNLPANLKSAMNSVVTRITGLGETVALTDFSLYPESHEKPSRLDQDGSPYLAPTQIYTADKSLKSVSTSSTFSSDFKYTADTAIYSSAVLSGNTECVVIGNILIPESSIFQYKRVDDRGVVPDKWETLTFESGDRFRDVLDNGRYKIRELGATGFATYDVYIDKSAPMVEISWKNHDGVSSSQIISSSSMKKFMAGELKIKGIHSSEADKYSYISLYTVSDLRLYGVYSLSDLQKHSLDLPNGTYYMIVADRSGNSYTIDVYINSSPLVCDPQVSENVKIKFTCNRKKSQIQEFYVKKNGEQLNVAYSESGLEFTEAGSYEFYVRDIYGNEYGPKTVELKRDYPTVVWKYYGSDGRYVLYDETNKAECFNVTRVSDGTFAVSSSVKIKFEVDSKYNYTFLGVSDNFVYSNNLDGSVEIKAGQSFQLKVYYRNHPEVYTIYNCASDITAPVISVSAQTNICEPDELKVLQEKINEAGGALTPGTVLNLPTISYSVTNTETKNIFDDDTIFSELIKVNISDDSALSFVEIYLDGALYKSQSESEGFSEIVLSRAGEYVIFAEDILGNVSAFSFINGTPNCFEYLVDGKAHNLGLHDDKKFDENGNYSAINYGNKSVSYVLSEGMNVFYKITDSDGTEKFVAFGISGGIIREAYYVVTEEVQSTGEITGYVPSLKLSEEELFNANKEGMVVDQEYVIFEDKKAGEKNSWLKIYAKVDKDGKIVMTVYGAKDLLTVEARLSTEDDEFYYTKTELSTRLSDLVILTEDNVVIDAKGDGEQVKLNKSFKISSDNFDNGEILSLNIYFSALNDFDEGDLSSKEINKADFYGEEGFYLIKAVNKYGNESVYRIHISNDFDVTSYVEFADGQKIHYSTTHKETLYSNSKVVFEIHSKEANVSVKKDGKDFQPIIAVKDGITYVTLSEDGQYTVIMSDPYNNSIERSAQINSAKISFNENLLVGYNENALKRDEGYTNQKLSIVSDVLKSDGLYYLAVQYGETLTVIYDSISEAKVNINESALSNIIGASGDGVYTVIIRNRYGSTVSKVIHYRGTPTLKLERETRTSTEIELYDLEKALREGFWSNGRLLFKTDAETYVFTINGDKTECPQVLAFTSSEQTGYSEYDITYVDEYGFSYTFKAYLVRQELEIKPAPEITGQYIDNVFTTREDILVLFSENATCTYTCNNSEEMVYTRGEKLSKDGIYRFVVVDYAGNVSSITMKKDTMVEFALIESNTSAVIRNGSVVNSSKISFDILNNDTAYIEKVLKNGVVQSDFSGSKFNGDGKWELIVSDKLGNKTYFYFYIVTREQNGFAYTTPYEYNITELWYDAGDGVKISYLQFVNQDGDTSSFDFKENGKYNVVMMSKSTGDTYKFEFTINTTPPDVSLVGCKVGETTINDVSLTGCKIGDRIKIYKASGSGEKLVDEIEVTSTSTKMPTITEGGEYRVVVESEAGVTTELKFVRKHVMNTAGSVFIMILIALSVVGLFAGLVYRNKSKTDD